MSGTAALTREGVVIAPDDAYLQTVEILCQIADALAAHGASIADVVRTRVFVTSIDDFEDVGRAHYEVFGEVRPASTCVAVTALVDPQLRVEIEVSAITGVTDGA